MKKTLVSICALTAITISGANAAVTKEKCMQSEKTIWVESVQNVDGTKGACVPKNACTSDTFKNKFCDTTFADIQVGSVDDAHTIINLYVKTKLNWSAGCTHFLDFDVNNIVGQDYIGCQSNGNYKVFEFDDTHEWHHIVSVPDFRKALCIAVGGQYTPESLVCVNINQTLCTQIDGNYNATNRICNLEPIRQDHLQQYEAVQDSMDARYNTYTF